MPYWWAKLYQFANYRKDRATMWIYRLLRLRFLKGTLSVRNAVMRIYITFPKNNLLKESYILQICSRLILM